jgi:hypothetical protein
MQGTSTVDSSSTFTGLVVPNDVRPFGPRYRNMIISFRRAFSKSRQGLLTLGQNFLLLYDYLICILLTLKAACPNSRGKESTLVWYDTLQYLLRMNIPCGFWKALFLRPRLCDECADVLYELVLYALRASIITLFLMCKSV